jgi:beta-lactam-binding protein with PASTA domain
VISVEHLRPEGTVVAQDPVPGDVPEPTARVALLVSRGPSQRRYRMPDLIGRPAERISDSLRRSGWNLASVRERTYPGLAQSIVLQQSPRAGYPVTPSTPISLEVSLPTP